MKLYAFYCGAEQADISAFDPFDPNVGTTIEIPWFFYLIQHPRGNVLFDTGAHPSLATDPHARLGAMADIWTITMKAGEDAVSQLRRIDLAPTDITHIVESHLHYDHAGGLEFFPGVPVYVQRGELQFAHWPPVYQKGAYVTADFDHPVEWREVDGEYDLFDDGRIVMLPTPGHTPGHQSLLVRLEGETVILLSDAAYLIEKMRSRSLPAVLWSPDAVVASWELIEDLERREGARLIATHSLDYATSVKMAPDAWYE
jgi:N-acyl homoserine lactone hydrolase